MSLSQGALTGRRADRGRRPQSAERSPRTRRPRLLRDRYELGAQIAAGGTARLFSGRDAHLQRQVAVKVLHPHLLPDAVSRHRLEREARAAAVLRHPGIAAVYDVTNDGRSPAIVMELVDGESLATLLRRRGPMPPGQAAELAAELADALYHAHRHGIVHRDVKPGNVLVERGSGRARLIDFGIAHSLSRGLGLAQLTETGQTLGTPRYMAPEQLAGEAVGPRTDLWGLGCVLYESVLGRPSFDGTTPLAISRQQAAGPPNIEGIDPRLARIIAACLARTPDGRPQDARAVATALRAWRDPHADVAALLWPRGGHVTDSAAHAAASRTPLAAFDPRGWGPRRRRLAAAVAVAVMLGLGLVVGTTLRPAAPVGPSVDAPVNEAVAPAGGGADHAGTDTTTTRAGGAGHGGEHRGKDHGGKGKGRGNGGGKGHNGKP